MYVRYTFSLLLNRVRARIFPFRRDRPGHSLTRLTWWLLIHCCFLHWSCTLYTRLFRTLWHLFCTCAPSYSPHLICACPRSSDVHSWSTPKCFFWGFPVSLHCMFSGTFGLSADAGQVKTSLIAFSSHYLLHYFQFLQRVNKSRCIKFFSHASMYLGKPVAPSRTMKACGAYAPIQLNQLLEGQFGKGYCGGDARLDWQESKVLYSSKENVK